MRITETAWDLTANQRLQSTLRALRDGASNAWTTDEFCQYLRFYKRRGKKTVDLYRRQLAFMERHAVAPVQLHGSRADLIESFSMYVTVREQIEGIKPTALKGDHMAVRALGSFLSIPDNVWPVAPRAIRTESRWVPSPEEIYELLQAQFGPRRSYEDALTRYMLAFSFGLGVRAPSEIISAKLADVDLEHASSS